MNSELRIMNHESEEKKYLVVGLGNPDPEFENTLHNVGFDVVNKITEDQEISWKKVKAVFGDVARFDFEDGGVILLKPLTFMNRSGLSVRNALNFWKINLDNLLIVQDDSDIELGRIKIGYKQSSGGHKGLDSIIQAVGGKKFARLKIGVRPADLPQGGKSHVKAEKFILRPMSKEKLDAIAKNGAEVLYYWLENGLAKTMSQYNKKV